MSRRILQTITSVETITRDTNSYHIEVTCDRCKRTEECMSTDRYHGIPVSWITRYEDNTSTLLCPTCVIIVSDLSHSKEYELITDALQCILDLYPEGDNDDGAYTYVVPDNPDRCLNLINSIGKILKECQEKLSNGQSE